VTVPSKWRLLESLNESDQRAVVEACSVVPFRSGVRLVHEGMPSRSFYFINRGHVFVEIASQRGDPAVVNVMGPGDCFGELGLLDPDGVRTASIVGLDDGSALELTLDQFAQLRSARPQVDLALMRHLAARVTALSRQIAETDYVASVRVARRLLDAARTFDALHDGGEVPLTQAVVAAMSRTSPRMVAEVYAGWRHRSIVETIGAKGVRIVDLDGLRREGAYEPARRRIAF
jgi:CRP/FNR family cyclic AMP-dependent transcriptional regulator